MLEHCDGRLRCRKVRRSSERCLRSMKHCAPREWGSINILEDVVLIRGTKCERVSNSQLERSECRCIQIKGRMQVNGYWQRGDVRLDVVGLIEENSMNRRGACRCGGPGISEDRLNRYWLCLELRDDLRSLWEQMEGISNFHRMSQLRIYKVQWRHQRLWCVCLLHEYTQHVVRDRYSERIWHAEEDVEEDPHCRRESNGISERGREGSRSAKNADVSRL